MSVYLDASVLVALFTDDHFTKRATAFLETSDTSVIVSDFATAEFAATIARHVRTHDLSANEAHTVFASFDSWTFRVAHCVQIASGDVAAAVSFLRRLDLTLRAPDALHIAICQRVAKSMMTFDIRMAASARSLGVKLADT
jgi:predicted nucleic acid-binding protein